MNARGETPHSEPNDLDTWFDRCFEEKIAAREASHIPSMTVIATKGTLDMAYLIVSSTADTGERRCH